MITINVVAYNGQSPVEPLSAEFDELGGSIGRGQSNTLVLPDPERHISRTHASILFRGGRYLIQDRGSATPVQVNGRLLGQGQESPIGEGDELKIGGYLLQVTVKKVVDSEATRFGKQPSVSRAMPKDDPLAFFAAGGTSKDPLADLISTAGVRPSDNPPSYLMDDPFAVPAAKGRQTGAIPLDFDPFADPRQSSTSSTNSAKLPDDFDLGFGSSTANQNIDELFGLDRAVSFDPFSPGSALGEPIAASGSSPASDPLGALVNRSSEGHAQAPQRNDAPELHGHFHMPQAKPDPAITPSISSSEPGAPVALQPAGADSPMVLSWEEHGTASGEIKTIIVGPQKREAKGTASVATPVPQSIGEASGSPTDPLVLKKKDEIPALMPATAPPVAELSKMPLLAPSVADVPESAPIGQDELLRAFLAGAGMTGLDLPNGLTLQTMHVLGTLLREAVQGTLDLLLARAMIKREVRAEVTMIIARENNPLKFSPNVEAALTHLLAPQGRGFMPPVAAMKDAYEDLRSHQLGFMAGMQAALAGVLRRFNPEHLEQRLTQKSVLDSLLPINRKAKLWNLFEDLYGDISEEAEEDFHALFGKEFVRAYEAHIDKLKQEEKS